MPVPNTKTQGGSGRSILVEYPGFGLFWCARGASALAFQIQGVAVGWQIYALTRSTFELGMVGLAQFLPMVLLTLVAGHVADRHDRRLVSAVAMAAQGVVMAFLAIGSRAGWLTPAAIFGAVAVSGAARAFERPASQALMPNLVPEALVPKAIAWGSSIFQTASIVGPAIGGFLYAAGAAFPYALADLLALAGAGLTAAIRNAPVSGARRAAGLDTIFSGLHFIRRQPVILGSISLDLFAVLLGGATALLPVYARDILRLGSIGLGLLRAAPSIGSLAMSAVLMRRPLQGRAGAKMFAAVFAFGAATVVFGLSRSPLLSFAALIALGAADIVSVVIRSSLVQLGTPDAMRGKVSAVNALFIGTSNQLGEFESGITAAWLGTVPATVLGGVGTLVVGALWMRLFPQLLAFDRLGGEVRKAG
jgi:MFS family permease